MADPAAAPPLEEVVELSGIPYPNGHPFSHITFACVVWNDAERLRPLLEHVRPWFASLAVAVQESTDDTLEIARELADIVVEDAHHGFGDATFGPRLLPAVKTPWTLKVDCDEWPTEELLGSLSNATWYAGHANVRGMWIPFRSWVDGIEYEEQHSHLRLFHTGVGWPPTLHSRPMIEDALWWPQGYIEHTRTLDEMIRDYLRYLDVGKGNPGWTAHNELMIRSACHGTASVKGWDYVKGHEWWPKVKAIVDAPAA